MEKAYKVVFVYPDNHIEEINEMFKTGREALECGNNLLGQVAHTERFFDKVVDEDDFFHKDPIEPYFMIVEVYNRKYHMVYDSRHR